jgi:hypothetical protein
MLRRIPPKNMEVPRVLPVGLHQRFDLLPWSLTTILPLATEFVKNSFREISEEVQKSLITQIHER